MEKGLRQKSQVYLETVEVLPHIDNFLAFQGPGMYADEKNGWISNLISNIC